MHHVIKGSIMIRVEDCQGFIIKGNTIDNVDILSEGPLPDELCVDYHKGASSSDGSDRMLADLRGISVAAVSAYDDDLRDGNDASTICSNTITNLKSEAKLIAGVDVQGVSTGVDLENNYVNLDRTAFDSPDDKWIGLRLRESASGIAVKQNNNFVQGVVIESESVFEGGCKNNNCPCRRMGKPCGEHCSCKGCENCPRKSGTIKGYFQSKSK